jgi:hypothetical protein
MPRSFSTASSISRTWRTSAARPGACSRRPLRCSTSAARPARPSALAACADDPQEQFGAFVRAYVVGHLVGPKLAQVTRREYLHLSPERCDEVTAERRRFREQLAEILRAGAKDGAFELIEGVGDAGATDGATGQALMVLDMCSRTSEWFDPHGPSDIDELTERYVRAARRLVGAAHP